MASLGWPFFITCLISLCLVIKNASLLLGGADPTDGFISVLLVDTDFTIEKPYDVPLAERYSHVDGVHRLWVYSTDKPFKIGSPTLPRTEIRIKNHDYSSGVWQFEGYAYVPNGTSGANIMQIRRSLGEKPATDLMLRVYDGELRYYSNITVECNVYDRWMRVNVVHDVDANKLTTFIDGVQKLEAFGLGASNFSYKCGVYGQQNESFYMESRWRDIKIYKKDVCVEALNSTKVMG